MTIVVDTGALIALADRSEKSHRKVRTIIEEANEPLVVSPFVVAEADHLVAARLGMRVELAVLADLADGPFTLESIDAAALRECLRIMMRFADLDIGVADASVVHLADRHRTTRILTLDERDFRALHNAKGQPFTLLPADARVRSARPR